MILLYKHSPLAEVTTQNFVQLILLEVLKQLTQIKINLLSLLNSSKLAYNDQKENKIYENTDVSKPQW